MMGTNSRQRNQVLAEPHASVRATNHARRETQRGREAHFNHHEESKKPPEDQPPPSRHPRRKAELESAEARHSDAIAKDCEESTAGVNTKIFQLER